MGNDGINSNILFRDTVAPETKINATDPGYEGGSRLGQCGRYCIYSKTPLGGGNESFYYTEKKKQRRSQRSQRRSGHSNML